MKRFVSVLMSVAILSLFFFFIRSANAGVGKGSPQFRAISGISTGGYGAMNIGLSHPGSFGTIACLGGPLDMAYFFKYLEDEMLGEYDSLPFEVKEPRIGMLQDLAISFGNPAYYNPLSTYYPPGISSDKARVPTALLGFKEVRCNPYGNKPAITYEDPNSRDWVEVLLALDRNGNGARDPGEPILRHFHEPFIDDNGNGMFDPGEAFFDVGLDGISETGDYGEFDGMFSYNPNRKHFMANDPLTLAKKLSLKVLQNLNLYLDAGTEDEFQFNVHAENFVQALGKRGLQFFIQNEFPMGYPLVSHFLKQNRVYVKYQGGHVGFHTESINLIFDQARQGNEEAILPANRFTALFGFVSDHFPGGRYGSNEEISKYPSKMGVTMFSSPSLKRRMRFGIYLPPGYETSKTTYYPVLYFLGGYNMSFSGMADSWMKEALDSLIQSHDMQKMIIVIPDGMNDKNQRGHFFVNQVDRERGDIYMNYFFDLVAYIDQNFRTK